MSRPSSGRAGIYKPLADQTHYVRLLKLLLDNETDEIRCQLSEHRYRREGRVKTGKGYQRPHREDGLEYTAVSYAWGSPDGPQHTIIINDRPFPLRQNLHDFLIQIRRSAFQGYLWIDAICIDQAVITEKNSQVAMMGDIFTLATSMVVWLGAAADDGDYVIDLMTQGDGASFDLRAWVSPGENASYYTTRTVFSAIKSITQRSYWTRTWVVQEIGLAAGRIEFRCGSRAASYEEWHRFFTGAMGLGRMFSGNMMGILEVQSVAAGRKLRELMDIHKDTICADPRDKLYTLLGLAADVQQAWEEGARLLRPDYTIPLDKLTWDVVDFYMSHSPSLRFDPLGCTFKIVEVLTGSRDTLGIRSRWRAKYGSSDAVRARYERDLRLQHRRDTRS